MNNTPCCTGEAVSLYAGAHSPCPPRALHLEAPCYRGKLHVDGQHPTTRASAPASPTHELSSRPTRLVPLSPHQQRRLTHWQGFTAGDLSAFYNDDYSVSDPRTSDEYLRRPSLLPAATAAAALASLPHNYSLQTRTRKATSLAHDLLPPLSNSTSPPKNPTIRRRRYIESCCRPRLHGHHLVDPPPCRQCHDLSSQTGLVSRLSDRMLAKASMSARSPRTTLGG